MIVVNFDLSAFDSGHNNICFPFFFQLQSQMHQTQAGPGGSAMTPEEIHEFFARQHSNLQQKASPPPQNFGSGNSSAGNSSHSTLHHRNS